MALGGDTPGRRPRPGFVGRAGGGGGEFVHPHLPLHHPQIQPQSGLARQHYSDFKRVSRKWGEWKWGERDPSQALSLVEERGTG